MTPSGSDRDRVGPPGRSRSDALGRWLAASLALAGRVKARVPRLVAIARIVYYPLALALVAYMAYQAVRKIDLSTVHWWALVAAYLAALVWWLALAFGWSALVTERYSARPVAAWCVTQVARYVPGGIWAPVARATTVEGRIRDKVAAVGAENVTVLCVSLAVGALWATLHDPRWTPLVLVSLAPLAAVRWLERRTRVTRKAVARAVATYAVGYVAYGVASVFAQIAISGLRDPTYPLYIAGASCVAWAVGLVVVFAPGGVGVREVVYVWMLSGLYPLADLKGAAVSSRVVTTMAELTVLAIATRPDLHVRRRMAARSGPATAGRHPEPPTGELPPHTAPMESVVETADE